jgi:hypothetical protein
MELNCPSCGKLSGKQEANMNWNKCTDMNKQPAYVNIENATSIFWIVKEKASIIGFPSGGDSIKVIEPPEAIIRGNDMPRALKVWAAICLPLRPSDRTCHVG